MAYEMVMPYHLHMPSYFLETFTEYPYKEVEAFLSVYPDYPPLLKNKILQAAYPLYRKYADKEKIN